MPITDGFTAFANLRRHPETARMPIVVISGNPDALTRARAPVGDRGAVVLLRKPFTLTELQAAVRSRNGLGVGGYVGGCGLVMTVTPAGFIGRSASFWRDDVVRRFSSERARAPGDIA